MATKAAAHPRETLRKRVSELQCLYGIASVAANADAPLEEQITKIVALLPKAFTDHRRPFARITVNGREYDSGPAVPGCFTMTADITAGGERVGSVEIGYRGAPDAGPEPAGYGPEALLLNVVAERLSGIIEQRQNRGLLRTIYESSPLGLYIMQDGTLRYTSPRFQAMTAATTEELRGMRMLDLVHRADREVFSDCTEHSLATKDDYPCEFRLLPVSGAARWVLQSARPIFYQGRDAVLGTLMDISRRKFLERKVVEFKELSKMKTDLLATVSHELRTPLTTIKGYATMMHDYYASLDAGEIQDYLAAVDGATDRLSRLVDNLLETSRLEAGLLKLDKRESDLGTLICEVANEARLRSARHTVGTAVTAGLKPVPMDERRIRQVLDNLVENAVKYSPEGGGILITARESAANVEVSVADEGPGIPPEELDHVFKRMFRLEDAAHRGADGLGLGLYLCQRIVKAHGGTIRAENRAEGGARITFTLPCREKKADRQTDAGRRREAAG